MGAEIVDCVKLGVYTKYSDRRAAFQLDPQTSVVGNLSCIAKVFVGALSH